MTYGLHWIVYVVFALLGWVGLVLVVGTFIHGRTQVWTRTNGTSVQLVCGVRRRRSGLPIVIPPQRDQPVSVMPRGGWL
jgi:hypothetical protein